MVASGKTARSFLQHLPHRGPHFVRKSHPGGKRLKSSPPAVRFPSYAARFLYIRGNSELGQCCGRCVFEIGSNAQYDEILAMRAPSLINSYRNTRRHHKEGRTTNPRARSSRFRPPWGLVWTSRLSAGQISLQKYAASAEYNQRTYHPFQASARLAYIQHNYSQCGVPQQSRPTQQLLHTSHEHPGQKHADTNAYPFVIEVPVNGDRHGNGPRAFGISQQIITLCPKPIDGLDRHNKRGTNIIRHCRATAP